MIKRILSVAIMFLSILLGYWWITWIMAIIFLFFFRSYYEIILWGIMYDALYGLPLPMFYNTGHVFTIFSIIILLLVFYLRKRLIIYDIQ